MTENSAYQGPAFFSYGFRPFFFSAALFAGIAIPAWVLFVSGVVDLEFLYTPRDWHMHEMMFGFLPCVIAGFVLTAMPNWTDRPPMRGQPLMLLLALWLAGRLVIAMPWFPFLASTIVDGAFLCVVAGIVWREIAIAKAWDRLPIGVLISAYAAANLLFHALFFKEMETGLAERLGLAIIILLLALIGGRVTPGFTEDFLAQESITTQAIPFTKFDGLAIGLIVIAAVTWVGGAQDLMAGWMFVVAGVINLARLSRWYGWYTWREPLVFVLHVGYVWLAVALLLLGYALLNVGFPVEEALHALTTGAVGTMTLAIMTRASLGHTGRTKHAGPLTVMMYALVNLGALLRVFGHTLHIPELTLLVLGGTCWSGAYVLFAARYGPMLFSPALDE